MLYINILCILFICNIRKLPKNRTADLKCITILNFTKYSQLTYKKIAAAHPSSISIWHAPFPTPKSSGYYSLKFFCQWSGWKNGILIFISLNIFAYITGHLQVLLCKISILLQGCLSFSYLFEDILVY